MYIPIQLIFFNAVMIILGIFCIWFIFYLAEKILLFTLYVITKFLTLLNYLMDK